MSEQKKKSETADKILDLAEVLIQTRGYSAFSYQDISDALGIRKASIHYHFHSKCDLGVAVVDRYAERFGTALAAMSEDRSKSSLDMLEFYVEPYMECARTKDRVCLCGALAGEVMALPPDVRRHVDRFFKAHQAWLSDILERGASRKELTLSAPSSKTARLIFGALQGALLVKRTTGDVSQLQDVVNALKSQIWEVGDSPVEMPSPRH